MSKALVQGKHKHKNQSNKLPRLLKIIEILKTTPTIKPEVLYKQLNISRSGFFKDKAALKKMGFEFQYHRQKYCYQILKDPYLPILNLNFTEVFALTAAVRQISASSDHALSYQAIEALQKIIANTEKEQRPLLQHALEKETLQKGFGCDLETLEKLRQAITENKRVTIHYLSASDQTQRPMSFDPYHLFFRKRALYVEGFRPIPKEYQGYKQLRLNRIKGIQFQPMSQSQRHPDYNFHERRKNAYKFFGAEGQLVTLRLRFTQKAAFYIREVLWHHSQIIKDRKDGGCDLILEIGDPKEAIRDFLCWGSAMTVIKPKEMREWVKKELEKSLELYR